MFNITQKIINILSHGQARGDLWAELKLAEMINIGWVRLSMRMWPKVGFGTAKELIKWKKWEIQHWI